MKKIIYAFRFLTIIPVKWKQGEDMGEVARSISFFPIVGIVIGISNIAVYYLSNMFFSPLFTSVAVIVWWIVITGGLHLDGLADTSDGVWGGTTKERRLEIMKDSRTGVFGVLKLVSFILLKDVIVHEIILLNHKTVYSILLLAPVIGRWISVISIFFFKSAKEDGLGHFFKENIGKKELVTAFLLTSIIIYLIAGLGSFIILFSVSIISVLVSLFFCTKLGGLTGDIYGTLCESSELLSLFAGLILFLSGLLNGGIIFSQAW
ncbi:MAG: adenosylcobinamide-GDP ribazoletransferase [Deltaproteobacteria bacterium]|nr:adenosylcobinamide-GDP ribazoletransferase [Deltaproteobacteria bacterium]